MGEAESTSLKTTIEERKTKLDSLERAEQSDSQRLKAALAEEKRLKLKLLEHQMQAQETITAAAAANKRLVQDKGKVDRAKQEAAGVDRKKQALLADLRLKQNQIDATLSRENAIGQAPELDSLAKQHRKLQKKLVDEKAEAVKNSEEARQATGAGTAQHGELLAVDARLEQLKSMVTAGSDQILDVRHDVKHEKKKQQVLEKVKQSWDDSLFNNKEALRNAEAQQNQAQEQFSAVEEQQKSSKEELQQQASAMEAREAKWTAKLKEVTKLYNEAHEHNNGLKAEKDKVSERMQMLDAQVAHKTKRLSELRDRKRALVQSKLEALDKQEKPFHEEAVEAMDKMATANQLRADAMEKTGAVVDSTDDGDDPDEKQEAPAGPNSAISDGTESLSP